MRLSEIELWLDMQMSPQLAKWIIKTFGVKTTSSYQLEFNTEEDEIIFLKAKGLQSIIVVTKDRDFAELQNRLSSPPKIILLKTGNCSNKEMKLILIEHLMLALETLINTTTELVEIKPQNIF